MVNLKIKFNLCILFFVLALLFPTNIFADDVIFQDNFDDNDHSDWITARNTCTSNWQIDNQTLGIIINSPCITEIIPSSLVIPDNSSYIFEVDMHTPVSENMDRNFVFKYLDSNNWYGIHTLGSNIYLHKVVNGSEYFLTNWHTNYPFSSNNIYNFKIVVTPLGYEVYINSIFHKFVPESGPTFNNQSAGLQASAGGISTSQVWFDNVKITELSTPSPTPSPTPTITPSPSPTPIMTPTPTPQPTFPTISLNVSDIKQFSLPWKNNIYDSANIWSKNPSIERWGCALTSASMILKFWGHGDYANPDYLNAWLKSQPDGYLSNGLVNWIAVTRFSKIYSNDSIPALEYNRLGNTHGELENELANGRPAILRQPGHFVVAKSKIGTTFGINDPGYSDRDTLEPYGNTFQVINSFTPTHTDLSYILLTIDPKFDIKVFDSNDTEIEGFTYIEDPIIDNVDKTSVSGKPLKIFQFPKPDEGNYQIEITGPKDSYELITYLYNENGEVAKSTKKGKLTNKITAETITIKTPAKKYKSKHTPYGWLKKFFNYQSWWR